MNQPFIRGERVALKAHKPLPNGKTVRLVGMLSYWDELKNKWEVRIVTPGLYGGGIYFCTVDEIEPVRP